MDRVVAHLDYPVGLITLVLYGCGLRLFKALNLRVGCLDFDERIVTVHDGKGKKDRTIPMPEVLIPALKNHIQRVSNLHEMDLKANYAGVRALFRFAVDRGFAASDPTAKIILPEVPSADPIIMTVQAVERYLQAVEGMYPNLLPREASHFLPACGPKNWRGCSGKMSASKTG